MDLQTIINQSGGLGKAIPLTNIMETRDQIVAMGLVKDYDFPFIFGANFTYPSGYKKIGASVAATSPEPLTGKNIVDAIRSLTLKSQAYFFPHGTMKGSKAMGTPTKQPTTYGINPIAKDTGTITENAELQIQGMHLNMEFWNSLRMNATGYQVLLFLNNMVIWVRPEHTPVFHDIGNAIAGDSANSISGGMAQLAWQSVGEIPWVSGVKFSDLAPTNFAFHFDVPTVTGISIGTCSSGDLKLNGTTAAGGTLTRAILEAAYADCVTYSIEAIEGVSNAVTINPTTGVVTVATGGTAGTTKYRVIAQNNTSVWATYDFNLTLV